MGYTHLKLKKKDMCFVTSGVSLYRSSLHRGLTGYLFGAWKGQTVSVSVKR